MNGFKKSWLNALAASVLVSLIGLAVSTGNADAGWPGTKFIRFKESRNAEGHVTAVEPDGKILVAGYVDTHPYNPGSLGVTRLLPNGQPDETFGVDGKAVARTKDIYFFFDMEVQKDGGVLVLGVGFNKLGIIRLNPDGTVDREFGNRGIASIPVFQDYGIPWGEMTIGDGNKITYAGTTYSRLPKPVFTTRETLIWRLNPDGSRDRSFGQSGVMKRAGAWSRVALAARTDSSGFTTAVGVRKLPGPDFRDFQRQVPVLMRATPEGREDREWASQGLKRLPGMYGAAPEGFIFKACQPGFSRFDSLGRVLVLATCLSKGKGQYSYLGVVLRYLPDGTLDTSFAGDGSAAIRNLPSTLFSGLAVGPGGSITVVGRDVITSRTGLTRLTDSGTLSSDFGARGFRVFHKRKPMFGSLISVDSRGWTFGAVNNYKRGKTEKQDRTWFGVTAVEPSNR